MRAAACFALLALVVGLHATQSFDTSPTLSSWSMSGTVASSRTGFQVVMYDADADGNADVAVSGPCEAGCVGNVKIYMGTAGAVRTTINATLTPPRGGTAGMFMTSGDFRPSVRGEELYYFSAQYDYITYSYNTYNYGTRNNAHRSSGTIYSVVDKTSIVLQNSDAGSRMGLSAVPGAFAGTTSTRDDWVVGDPRDFQGKFWYYKDAPTSQTAPTAQLQPEVVADTYGYYAYYGRAATRGKYTNAAATYDTLIMCGYGDGRNLTHSGRCVDYTGSSSGPVRGTWSYLNPEGANSGDLMGWAATTMDCNKDGLDDLILGVPGGYPGGKVYVFHGSASGLPTTPTLTIQSPGAVDFFGQQVISNGADFNADGYADLLVGAPTGGALRQGRVYAYAGSASGLSSTPLWTLEGSQAGSLFGHGVGTGYDVNKDGYTDLIVGAPFHDTTAATTPDLAKGAAFIYLSPKLMDLGVTLTPSTTALVVTPSARSVTLTLGATNAGPGTSSSVQVIVSLDADATYVSGGGNGFTCVLSGTTATCTIASMAVGASVSFPIVVSVPVTFMGDLIFSTTIEGTNADTNSANNAASTTVMCYSNVALSISSFTVMKASAATLDSQSWVVNITNAGPSYANSVKVAMPWVTGITYSSASYSAGGCAGTVTCDFTNVAPGTTVGVVVTGVLSTGVAVNPVVTVATVSTTSTNTGSPLSRTLSFPVTINADLSLTQIATPNPYLTGDGLISWAIALVNNGPSDAAGVVFQNRFDSGLSLTTAPTITVSPALSQNPSCTVVGVNAPLVTCTVPVNLPRSYIVSINFVTLVAADATYADHANVTATSPDSNAANNVVSNSVHATVNSDVGLAMSATANPTLPGDGLLSIAITIGSFGPSDAYGIFFLLPVPSNAISTGSGTSAVISTGNCTVTSTVLTCAIPYLATNSLSRLDVVWRVASSTTISLTGKVNSTSTDMVLTNNVVTLSGLTPTVSSDLAISMSASPNYQFAGDGKVQWFASVVAGGPSDALSCVVNLMVDARLTISSYSLTVGGVSQNSSACTVVNNLVRCAVSVLSRSSTAVLSADSYFAAPIAGNLVSFANVSSSTPDPNSVNNKANVSTTATVKSDLSLSLVATKGNGFGSWTAVVANIGPADAYGVSVTVKLPTAMYDLSATVTNVDASCVITGTTAVCTINAAGQRLAYLGAIRVAVTGYVVVTDVLPLYTAVAFVNSSTPDPNTANNAASASTTVPAVADIKLSRSAVVSVILGRGILYSVLATNYGPLTAIGVVIDFTLPAGLRPASQPTLTNSTGQYTSACTDYVTFIRCYQDQMAVYVTVNLRLVVVAPYSIAPLLAYATVNNSLAMGTLAHRVDFTTEVLVQADLAIGLIPSTVSPVPQAADGSVLTYQMVVSNGGANNASQVQAVMTLGNPNLPNSIITVLGAYASACVVAAPTITCELGTMALNQRAIINIQVNLRLTDLMAFNSTAVVTMDTYATDPVMSNNYFQGALVTPISNINSDLTLGYQLATVPSPPLPGWFSGEALVLGFLVTNYGPVVAAAANLTMSKPEGVALTAANVTGVAGGSCEFPTDLAVGEITCQLGNMSLNAIASVTVYGTVTTITALAPFNWSVNALSASPDPDLSDNYLMMNVYLKPLEVTTNSTAPAAAVQVTTVVVPAEGDDYLWLWILIPILLVLIIACILWRCGFFKRTRPPTADEEDKKGAPEEAFIPDSPFDAANNDLFTAPDSGVPLPTLPSSNSMAKMDAADPFATGPPPVDM